MPRQDFQHRHFVKIAAVLNELRQEPACDQATLDMVTREFVRFLSTTNIAFDPDRFEAATKGEFLTGCDRPS
jgi:hypothetical protein